MYFSKSFNVARTYLEREIVQNSALTESHLLINFIKNELPHKESLSFLRVIMEASTCHNMKLILSRYLYLLWSHLGTAFPYTEFESIRQDNKICFSKN